MPPVSICVPPDHRQSLQEKKVESDAAENEKDASTEKESNKDGAGDASATASVSSPTTEKQPAESDSDAANKTQENGGSADETLNDSKTAAAEDSNKKPKKVKKKWSFRSISFSKKDKQKPAKKEKEGEEKVNGECEKVPEEVSAPPPHGVFSNSFFFLFR